MIGKMMTVVALVCLASVALVAADGGYGHGHHGGHGGGYGHDHHKPAHYSFKYGVKDDYKGANFGHEEHRQGYNTKGSYYVHLPDGRIQTVHYTADKHGYHPTVSYSGYAHHDKGHGHGGHGHGGHGHGGHGHGGYH